MSADFTPDDYEALLQCVDYTYQRMIGEHTDSMTAQGLNVRHRQLKAKLQVHLAKRKEMDREHGRMDHA